jgi:hypothetical protein
VILVLSSAVCPVELTRKSRSLQLGRLHDHGRRCRCHPRPGRCQVDEPFVLSSDTNRTPADVLTPTSYPPRYPTEYDKVFAFLIALKAVDIFFGIGYDYVDRKYLGRVLFYSERRRAQDELETTAEERSQGLRSPIKSVTWLGIAVLGAMIATSYTLFIYYAM